MGQVAHDAQFWALVEVELLSLPRPWEVLQDLKRIDPELRQSLVNGERWLLRPEQTVEDLEEGWEWWLSLYRQAIGIVEANWKRATA